RFAKPSHTRGSGGLNPTPYPPSHGPILGQLCPQLPILGIVRVRGAQTLERPDQLVLLHADNVRDHTRGLLEVSASVVVSAAQPAGRTDGGSICHSALRKLPCGSQALAISRGSGSGLVTRQAICQPPSDRTVDACSIDSMSDHAVNRQRAYEDEHAQANPGRLI